MEEIKRKATPSVPANYVSIHQLQERWNIEKEWKQKQKEDEGREKQQVEEEQKIEEDLKKPEVKGTRRKRLHRKKNRKGKKSVDGGEAEKEEPAAIERVGGEDAAPRNEGLSEKKRGFGKRYKNQDVAPVEDVVGSIAPPPAIESVGGKDAEGLPEKERKLWKRSDSRNQYVAVEEDVLLCASIINTPEIRVKRKKAKGKKSAENHEKAVTAIETQFENLSIKSEETKTITRSCEEEPAAIGGEVTAEGLPMKKRGFRKRYDNKKKKKNQDMALVEDVVGCGGSIATENNILVKDDRKKTNQHVAVEDDVAGSIPPPPETENKFPMKDEIRVYRKKEENTKGNGNVEKAAMYGMAIKTRSSNRNPPNHLPPRRVRMPIADGTMVWVKKENKTMTELEVD